MFSNMSSPALLFNHFKGIDESRNHTDYDRQEYFRFFQIYF